VAMEKPAWAATSLIVGIMVSALAVNVFVSGLSGTFVTAG
jgi:small neutral amino acid transporter SnatA (MarC family)